MTEGNAGRELTGKVAVVTGAAGGLGRAFVRTLAAAGADVVLVDVAPEGTEEAASEIRDEGGRSLVQAADVSDPDAVSAVMKEAVSQLGGIDILVNNAGGSLHTPKDLEEIRPEHWDRVLDVNLKGTFLCCQAAVPHMRDRGGGRIVNVSSIGGRTASIVTGVPYAAAKAGVIGLTRRLAVEVARWGILVNAIAPGTVLSGPRLEALWEEMSEEERERTLASVPLGRLGTAEEQADMLRVLVGPASRYVTGAVFDVNGGRFLG